MRTHSYVFFLTLFSCAATALAAIGIYGVMTYLVAERTREIGIRVALGASTREVMLLFGRQAIRIIAAGLVVGLLASLAASRLIATQLWGITPTDPATFAGVSALLGLVVALACWMPVRRALRADPTLALKYE